MTVGEKIRECRKDKKLSQKQLGERCGIAEPTIRRYELGKLNPKAETLERIANALEVPVSDLLRHKAHTSYVTPIVPGPMENDPNMAELCFRNGEANMKEKVIALLMEHAQIGPEPEYACCHRHIEGIIRQIEKL